MSRQEHRPEKWAEAWLESRVFQRTVLCIAGASCALRVVQAGNLSALCSFLLDFVLVSGLMFGIMQQWMSHKYQSIAKTSAMEMLALHTRSMALAESKNPSASISKGGGSQTEESQDSDHQEDDQDEEQNEPELQAGSPADLILEVLDLITEGGMPHSHDLHLLRDSILKGALHNAMYQPLDLGQDLHRLTMEPDVEASLYQQLLGCTMMPQGTIAAESAQECLQPDVRPGLSTAPTGSGRLRVASSLESELEEGPSGNSGFLAKILSSLASDTGGILKAKHPPPGRSKSSTILSKLMVLQQGRRLSYKEEPKAPKRVSETIMGDPTLMVLEDSPSSPPTGGLPKSVPARRTPKDSPSSPQSALDSLMSKVRPASQEVGSSNRRSSWHVMSLRATEDVALPNDTATEEDRRKTPAAVHGGEKERGGGKSKPGRRWSVGWLQSDHPEQQQQQQQQHLLHGHEALARPFTEEMDRVLGQAYDNFSFNSFELAAVTQGHPLSTLAYFLFHKTNLITGFNLHAVKLARFLRSIEAGYPQNPYHNAIHAADVLQTLHVIMHRGGMVPHFLDRLSLMAALMAAIIHDYEHTGLTNDFLVNTSSTLALRYNDRAPLENHHLAASFSLLCTPDQDFMAKLSKAEYTSLRKTVIDLVLATDMKQHFALMGQFNAVVWYTMQKPKQGEGFFSPRLRFGRLRKSKSHGRATPSRVFAPPLTPKAPATTDCNFPTQAKPVESPVNTLTNMFGSVRKPRKSSEAQYFDIGTGADSTATQSNIPVLQHDPSIRNRVSWGQAHGHPEDSSKSGSPLSSQAPKQVPTPSSSASQACMPSLDHLFLRPGQSPFSHASKVSSNTGLASSTERSEMELPSGLHAGGTRQATQAEPVSLDDAQKLLLLQIALKCADLGHVAEDQDVHIRWVHALEEEFYRQGDREKAAKLPVSPLFDRVKPGVTKSQVGFFDVVVLPLYQALTNALPGVQPLLDGAERNYRFWKFKKPSL